MHVRSIVNAATSGLDRDTELCDMCVWVLWPVNTGRHQARLKEGGGQGRPGVPQEVGHPRRARLPREEQRYTL